MKIEYKSRLGNDEKSTGMVVSLEDNKLSRMIAVRERVSVVGVGGDTFSCQGSKKAITKDPADMNDEELLVLAQTCKDEYSEFMDKCATGIFLG